MSERGSGLDRIRSMWIMLGAFLITAVGASVALLFLDPDRQDSGVNEWLILAVIVLAAAAAPECCTAGGSQGFPKTPLPA